MQPLTSGLIPEPNMNGYVEFAPSPGHPRMEPLDPRPGTAPVQEDVDMSSGSSGNEANENSSMGRESQGSDCDDSGKELGMLVEPPDTHQGSQQSAKADMHRELIRTLKELKVHLPADRKAKGKASTLATLKYALRSVKQVKANEEYYQLLMSSESQPCGVDVPSYSVEEVESATSEYVVKNGDMFAVAVSLVTGRILYISEQVASIFRCKRDAFSDAKFVEFLAPHDVSVFHGCTTPCKLPAWSACSRGATENDGTKCGSGFGTGRGQWPEQRVERLLAVPTSHIRALVGVPAALLLVSSLLVHLGRQQQMARCQGPWYPRGRAGWSFGLVRLWLLLAFVEGTSRWKISLSLCLCHSLPFK